MNSPVYKIGLTVGYPIKQLFGFSVLQKHLNRLTYLHNCYHTLAMGDYTYPNRQTCFHRSMLRNNVNLRNTSVLLTQNERRTYAKKAIVKESKGKSHMPKMMLTDDEMLEVVRIDIMRSQMERVLDQLKNSFIQTLAVRTTSGAIENLLVTIKEEQFPLNEIAQIHQKGPNLIVVNLSNCPDGLKPTLEAIEKSEMNLNPQQEGTVIYLPLSKVTREHRENLAKGAKSLSNKAKEDLRDIHNKFIKDAKNKKGSFSEDLVFNVQAQIKWICDGYAEEGDKMLQTKLTELLGET